MGRPPPGVPVVLVDPATGEPAEKEGEICLDLSQAPLTLMTGQVGAPEGRAEATDGGYHHTGDVASRATPSSTTSAGATTTFPS
nr:MULTISPECIES: AMP-binding protein [unclassified Pseudonocardia]